jgi:hypothetical protein
MLSSLHTFNPRVETLTNKENASLYSETCSSVRESAYVMRCGVSEVPTGSMPRKVGCLFLKQGDFRDEKSQTYHDEDR